MGRDPLAVQRARCDTCGRLLEAAERNTTGRCASCAEGLSAGKDPAELQRVYQSAKVDGSPWWESGRPVFVAAYPDLDAIGASGDVVAWKYSEGALDYLNGLLRDDPDFDPYH